MIVVDRIGDGIIMAQVKGIKQDDYPSLALAMRRLGFRFDTGRRAWVGPADADLISYFGDQVQLVQSSYDIKSILDGYIKYDPFPYQWEGASFLYTKHRAVLSDDMGLGKTLQIIMAVRAGLLEGVFSKVLITCPAHLVTQWESEILKFTDLVPVKVRGDKKERAAVYEGLSDMDSFIAILNYELLRGIRGNTYDLDNIKSLGIDCLVCDEVHHAKDRSSRTAKALRGFKDVPYKFLATGTPFQKHAEDVFSIFEILDPSILGSVGEFRRRYIIERFNGRYRQIRGYRHLDELHQRIALYIIRRAKKDVGLQLPEKIQQTIMVDMTSDQIKIHQAILGELQDTFKKLETSSGTRAQVLENRVKALFNFLQEVADSPALLAMSESKDSRKFASIGGKSLSSPKIDLIEDIVEQKIDDEKIVIFTKYKRFLDLIAGCLSKYGLLFYHSGIGDKCQTNSNDCLTCGLACGSRKYAQWAFNNDDNKRILICTDAGQEGLNLQAGSTLIHADLLWNPAGMDQRSDRIHRLNSPHEKVHIIQLVSAGSIEEKIMARLSERRLVGKSIIEGIKDVISKGGR